MLRAIAATQHIAAPHTPRRPPDMVARRITDARGMTWEVRDVWTDGGHAVLFTCTVAGIRSELHAADVPLARLSDDVLLDTLTMTDD
ncbi:MAG TPA: hypothetical protein VHM30_03355 [Gemmatimonadaceae bacterium]|nr:hypothetical protein [Gemmatimonadaceae bacterium]